MAIHLLSIYCNHLIHFRMSRIAGAVSIFLLIFNQIAQAGDYSSVCEQSIAFHAELKESTLDSQLTSPELIRLLEQIDKGTSHLPDRVAAFDFDGTIFPYDIGAMVRSYFVENPRHTFSESIDGNKFWKQLDEKKEDFAPYQAMLIAGYTQKELNEIVQSQFFPTGLPLFSEIITFINELKKRGIKVIIVSASPQPILRALASFLNLPVNQILGTDVQVGDNLVFIPEVNGTVSNGPEKTTKLKEYLQSKDNLILAAGNTTWDKELLLKARFGLSIRSANPGHNHYLSELKLSLISAANAWSIHYPESFSFIKSDP